VILFLLNYQYAYVVFLLSLIIIC